MPHDLPQVSWLVAFLAGALSFISPCVLPLIPGYISHVSGMSADELKGGASRHTVRLGMLVVSNKMFYVSIWSQKLFTRFGPNL